MDMDAILEANYIEKFFKISYISSKAGFYVFLASARNTV